MSEKKVYIVSVHCAENAHSIWRVKGSSQAQARMYVDAYIMDCCTIDCCALETSIIEDECE